MLVIRYVKPGLPACMALAKSKIIGGSCAAFASAVQIALSWRKQLWPKNVLFKS